MNPQILIRALQTVATTVLLQANQNPNIPIQAKPVAVEQIAHEVAAEAVKVPELQHIFNAESKWWQKRSNWSWIITVFLVPLLGGFGYTMAPAHQELAAVVAAYIGNLIGGYFARRAGTATKPLFAK